MLEEFIHEFLTELSAGFTNPQKRIFWGYLACAGAIAFVWLKFRRRTTTSRALQTIFARESWWSRSSRADYGVMTLNATFMTLLSPRVLGQATVALVVFQWMHELYGGRPAPLGILPDWCVMLAFTACLFVLDDFARYWVHRMLHRIPVLWAFHKVHHSATALNPLTVFRTHPIESIIFSLRGALVQGICIAVFVFFFGGQVQLVTVLGAGILNFLFNALGANLRHSHIPVGFWKPAECVFISPAQHQIHHSTARRHQDRNFGVALAVWDVMFGTHCHSEPDVELEFGIAGERGRDTQKLAILYLRPFRDAAGSLVVLVGQIRHGRIAMSR